MAQEEQSQKCSNSSSGGGGGVSSIGRSSKKAKQKKVPQRGLGVAQLEKIRLEEQQKKDVAVVVGASSIFPCPPSTLSATKSSFLSVTPPNFHHSNQYPSSSITFPHPPTDLSSPNSLFRPPPLVQNIDASHSSTVPLPNSLGWPPIPPPGHGSVPKLWNSCDYNLEKENSGVDPGLAFRSNLSLPYESHPMWSQHCLMARSQPFQEPSSMVNVSSAPSSSSVLNFQMEPPSNQSYYGNYRPMWPDEEKMVGMKRPYPFSLENPPGPSFHCKLPTIAHPISDESASCGNGGAFNLEPGHPIFREGPASCSTPMSQLNSTKKMKDNGVFGGDFLTLGPPTSTSNTSKFKQPSGYLRELPDFDSLPYQGSAEDPMFQSGPSGWNHHQQPAFYSFLPPAKVQTGQATTSINYCNGEVGGETIDLNLKL